MLSKLTEREHLSWSFYLNKMKKNKNLQYILLILAISIWGSIAFQMCHFLEGNSVERVDDDNLLPILDPKWSHRDSFSILINYPDPFLNKTFSQKKINQKLKGKRSKYKRPTPPPKSKVSKPQVIPKITYQGFSINNNRITKVRVTIDQQAYTLQQTHQKKGITLLEMYKDSIIIAWKGERKKIKRQR